MSKRNSHLIGFGFALVIAGSLMPGAALASSHSELSRLGGREGQGLREHRGTQILRSAAASSALESAGNPIAGFVLGAARSWIIGFVADDAAARTRSHRGAVAPNHRS